jgi:hypothetical protein
LSYAPLKIGIFLDDIGKHSQCVALPKVIVKVASSLNESHDVILLDDLPESDFILTELGEDSVCVQGGLNVLAVLGRNLINQGNDDFLSLLVEDFVHGLLLWGEVFFGFLVILRLLTIIGLVIKVGRGATSRCRADA